MLRHPALTSRALRAALLLPSLLFAACSGGDVVVLKVNVNPDFSGTVSVRGMRARPEPATYEAATKGAEWQDRVEAFAVRGTFPALAGLDLGGITFAPSKGDNGAKSLRVTVLLGEDARWCKATAPAIADQKRVSTVFQADGATGTVGTEATLMIDLPGEVIGVGHAPGVRGVQSSREGKRAMLLLPVKSVLERAGKLTFDITWQ